MKQLLKFFRSTVGRKYIMGATGLALSGFVFGHMTGNLLIFKGAEAYNTYGHMITSNPAYPIITNTLIIIFLFHIGTAMSLAYDNIKARPVGYVKASETQKAASLASRLMVATGSLIGVFVVLHLMTFKYGTLYMTVHSGVEMRDLYRLVVEVFSNPLWVIWYVIAVALLGVHLKHGFYACFQSLGFNHPKYTPYIKKGAIAYGIIIAAGFISQPLYVALN